MEGDTIRSSGGHTLIDLWIDGAMREIVITREAIAAAAGADRAAAMGDEDRCDFIRTRMALVLSAARTAVAGGGRDLHRVMLKAACLVDPSLGADGERRRAERRGNERRRASATAPARSGGERRRAERRRNERRGTNSLDAPV